MFAQMFKDTLEDMILNKIKECPLPSKKLRTEGYCLQYD